MKKHILGCYRKTVLLSLMLLSATQVYAWGKRGHETVGSLAAQLLSEKHKGAEFLINHSFDMGYYNNVPDIVWKSNPETYKKEFFQHFMDMEDYSSVKASDWDSDKVAFFKKHPDIDNKAGRSFWRIQGLYSELEKISSTLSQKKVLSKEEQNSYQVKWLLYAGVLGHYIADLAQPLHVTNKYDGKKTNQKGIHMWFEETLVDYLYPNLQPEVYKKAVKDWDEFHKKNSSLTVFELSQKLAVDSQKQIPQLLKLDKINGRKNISVAAKAYREMIKDRQVEGVLYLAEIWSRQTNWPYKGDRFYNFESRPTYIEP
jgi:hypothetical protein